MVAIERKSLRETHPDIFGQINHELTAEYYPKVNLDSITYGSKKKIWWNCPKDPRHVWDAQINARTVDGKGCLVCAGYRVMAGINDLASLNPTLASQWHPSKNDDVHPVHVSPTTNKKAWWQCLFDARHEWEASIKDRHYGSGCPVCVNKLIIKGVNDFATHHPELLGEWNHELNSSLTPYTVSPSSAKKIWWNCPKDDRHIYLMSLNDRHNSHGCTVCSGRYIIPGVNDAATFYPELISEWHPTRNGKLRISEVAPMSSKPAWWLCRTNPTHEWQVPIVQRTNQSQGCPICDGKKIVPGLNDLATHNPDLASQWHPTSNNGIQPDSVAPFSATKYWWKCEQTGHHGSHVWEASPNNRNGGKNIISTGCPKCIVYKTENAFRDLFNSMTSLEFVDGRVPVKWNKRNFTQIDILNEKNKLCIEYDGLWSHGGKNNSPLPLNESTERDVRKTEALLAAGYAVIRIREAGLPNLLINNPKYFQVSFQVGEDKGVIAERCIDFVRIEI